MKKELSLEDELKRDFERRENLYKNGGSDPFWSDGLNLNLVRNHIINDKRRIEESYSKSDYPQIYYKPTPLLVSDNYMCPNDKYNDIRIKRFKQHEPNWKVCNQDEMNLFG